jgi:hypothetical protein
MQLGERIRSLFEPRDAAAQAEKTFRSLWATTARAGSTRHPFHREVLTDLDMLLDQVYATRLTRLSGSGMSAPAGIRWSGSIPTSPVA